MSCKGIAVGIFFIAYLNGLFYFSGKPKQMDTATILAIASLLVAILNRPIEKLWDALPEHKDKIKEIGFVMWIIIKPIYFIGNAAYVYFALPFDKKFVLYLCLSIVALFFTLALDLQHAQNVTINRIRKRMSNMTKMFIDKR